MNVRIGFAVLGGFDGGADDEHYRAHIGLMVFANPPGLVLRTISFKTQMPKDKRANSWRRQRRFVLTRKQIRWLRMMPEFPVAGLAERSLCTSNLGPRC